MIDNIKIKLSELVLSFSKALDFVNPSLTNLHMRVAIIAGEIAREFGIPRQDIVNIFLASTIHDIGAFYLKDRLATLEFEIENPQIHAERGYLFLKDEDFDLFPAVSKIIRYHHMPWMSGRGRYFDTEEVPILFTSLTE